MKIILAPADRDRYGCTEVLDWNDGQLSVDEAIEIQERTGVEYDGWIAFVKSGHPAALKAVVWMALNRAGHQISWADVQFDVFALELGRDQPASPGKEPASTPPPPSETAETP